MKKSVLAVIVANLFLITSLAKAAPIITVTQGSTGLGNVYSVVNIDPNGFVFNAVQIVVTAESGILIGENDPNVFEFTAGGTADNTDGLGLDTLAQWGCCLFAREDSPTRLQVAGGPLGELYEVPVDFAQIVMAPGGEASVTLRFADNGILLFEFDTVLSFVIPEPTSLVLSSVGLCVLTSRRRRT